MGATTPRFTTSDVGHVSPGRFSASSQLRCVVLIALHTERGDSRGGLSLPARPVLLPTPQDRRSDLAGPGRVVRCRRLGAVGSDAGLLRDSRHGITGGVRPARGALPCGECRGDIGTGGVRRTEGETLADPGHHAAVSDVVAELSAAPQVAQVADPFQAGTVSDDGTIA